MAIGWGLAEMARKLMYRGPLPTTTINDVAEAARNGTILDAGAKVRVTSGSFWDAYEKHRQMTVAYPTITSPLYGDNGGWEMAATTTSTPETTVQTIEKPTPEPALAENDRDEHEEYFALAEKLGLQTPALIRRRLLMFLQREEIPVYNYDRVARYMQSLSDAEAKKKGLSYAGSWGFDPLRNKDAERFSGAWRRYGARVYQHVVPLDVLKLVDRIETGFTAAPLYFGVTDYQAVRPDPFLGIAGAGEIIVVAVWDEPGFKDAK